MMIKKCLFCFLLSFLLVATSCKSKKQAVVDPLISASATNIAVLETAFANNVQFNKISASGTMHLNLQGQQIAAPFSLRMASDSMLWLSIRPFMGIEAVRVLMDVDTIRILDKLNKTYTIKPLNSFSDLAGVPLSLALLERVLIGNLPEMWKNNMIDELKKTSIFQIKEGEISGIYGINKENARPLFWELSSNKTADSLFLAYQTFGLFGTNKFPTTILAEIKQIKRNEVQKIKIEFSSFTVEEQLNFSFAIPPKYREIR